MCRWMAYTGSPILMEDFLFKLKHSLNDQALAQLLSPEEASP